MTNTTLTSSAQCLNCSSATLSKTEPWLEYCPRCFLWRAHLKSNFDLPQGYLRTARDFGFRSLRLRNFKKILKLLSTVSRLPGSSIVDVGCAQGWFVSEAQQLGMIALGIEPEPTIAQLGIEQGLPIRVDFFPDALNPKEQFDHIIFNDVFEHLPDPQRMLTECHKHLNDNGLLTLNIPSSNGFFFRIAQLLAVLGFNSSLRRLWQVDFYTPHLFYFNEQNLTTLVEKNGFKKVVQARLTTISVEGLWARLSIPGASIPLLKRIFLFSLVVVVSPFINFIFPADAVVSVFQKN